jgi:hypothetical protein
MSADTPRTLASPKSAKPTPRGDNFTLRHGNITAVRTTSPNRVGSSKMNLDSDMLVELDQTLVIAQRRIAAHKIKSLERANAQNTGEAVVEVEEEEGSPSPSLGFNESKKSECSLKSPTEKSVDTGSLDSASMESSPRSEDEALRKWGTGVSDSQSVSTFSNGTASMKDNTSRENSSMKDCASIESHESGMALVPNMYSHDILSASRAITQNDLATECTLERPSSSITTETTEMGEPRQVTPRTKYLHLCKVHNIVPEPLLMRNKSVTGRTLKLDHYSVGDKVCSKVSVADCSQITVFRWGPFWHRACRSFLLCTISACAIID